MVREKERINSEKRELPRPDQLSKKKNMENSILGKESILLDT